MTSSTDPTRSRDEPIPPEGEGNALLDGGFSWKLLVRMVKSRVGQNSAIGFLDQVGNGLLWLVILGLAGRYLGVAAFGGALLAVTYGELFATLSDFGIGYMTVRETAIRGRHRMEISSLVVVKTLLVPPGVLVVGVVAWSIEGVTFFLLLGLAFVAYAFKTFRTFMTSIFNGHERFWHTAASNVTFTVTAGATVFALLYMGQRSSAVLLWGVLIGNAVAGVATLWILTRQYDVVCPMPDLSDLWSGFRAAVPFGLFFVGTFFYYQLDTFILSALQDDNAVGIYQAAFRFIKAAEIVPGVFAAALYPAVSRSFVHQPERARRLIRMSSRWVMLGGALLGGVLFVAAPLIELILGPEFDEAVVALRILAVMLPFRALAHILGVSLTSVGSQMKRFLGVYIAAGVSIGLNLILVPRWSFYGTCIAALVTSGVLCLVYFLALRGDVESEAREAVLGQGIGTEGTP